jgi:hypothetical protein
LRFAGVRERNLGEAQAPPSGGHAGSTSRSAES